MDNEQEYIIYAAINRSDGVIATGRDHSEIIRSSPYGTCKDGSIQGFITNFSRFVIRGAMAPERPNSKVARTLRREMEMVYDQFGPQLFTCALSVTRCSSLAEDAIHEAFCRGFRLSEVPRNVKAYMFRSVRNAAIDEIRKRSRASSLEEDYIFDGSSGPVELAVEKQFRGQVAGALMKLAPDERETIVQHIYADLTFREISELRDCPLGTVTSWYRRGIAKLKNEMEK